LDRTPSGGEKRARLAGPARHFRHEGAFPQRAGGNVDKVINGVASIRFRQGHGRSLGAGRISFNGFAKDLGRILEQALKADEITGDPKSG
jgi:hypothetical protein